MPELNRFQDKRIKEFIANQGKEKDIDAIQQHIIDTVLLNGLNNQEIAAVLFSTMRNILSLENNKKFLCGMNIKDPSQLGVEATLQIQKLLTKEYAKTLDENGKPKKKGNRKKK